MARAHSIYSPEITRASSAVATPPGNGSVSPLTAAPSRTSSAAVDRSEGLLAGTRQLLARTLRLRPTESKVRAEGAHDSLELGRPLRGIVRGQRDVWPLLAALALFHPNVMRGTRVLTPRVDIASAVLTTRRYGMRGAGRAIFAAVLLLIAGTLNIIYGIGALDSANIYANDTRYIFTNLNTMGWVLIILGLIQLTGGFSLMAGNTYGRVIGLVGASLGAIGASAVGRRRLPVVVARDLRPVRLHHSGPPRARRGRTRVGNLSPRRAAVRSAVVRSSMPPPAPWRRPLTWSRRR